MNSIRRFAAVTGLALLVATSLHAEVSVKPGARGPEVLVQPTEQGPWSPRGALNPSVLNPGGDLMGDGHPVVAASGRKDLVAWQKPASGRIVLAEWTGRSWVTLREWSAPAPVASLRLVTSGDDGRALVAWQELGSECSTVLATDSQSGPLLLEGERLIAASLTGSRVELLTLSGDGALLLSTGGLPDVPEPIGLSRQFTLTVLPTSVDCMDPAPVLGLAAALEQLDDEHSLVSWWDGPQRLASVVSGPDGIGEIQVLEHSGHGVSQPRVLRKKARKLALASLD